MASAAKTIGISALVTVGIYALVKLAKMGADASNMIDTLDFGVKIKKFKFGTTITLELDLDIINPSDFEISFRKPYVELYFTEPGGQPERVATSSTSNDICEVKATTKSTIENISLSMSLITFLGVAKKTFQVLFTGIDFSNMNFANLSMIASTLSANLNQLYQYFSIKVLTNVGGIPINKTFTLG